MEANAAKGRVGELRRDIKANRLSRIGRCGECGVCDVRGICSSDVEAESVAS